MYGTGTVDFDSYEYPMYGKFDIRGGDTSKFFFNYMRGKELC